MRRLLVVLSVFGVAALLALSAWQVQRLEWKTRLIAEVAERLAAAPVAATAGGGPEYTRVTVTGRFLGPQVLVKAVTERGAGFWVMAPLQADGFTLWVNRGFVPDMAPPAPSGVQTLTGLVRETQPGGGFLRSNDPEHGRWFSRDVAGLSAAEGVTAAPWFLDAQTGGPLPVPGLTVVDFPNHHLQYALTWAALAAMLAGASWWNLGRRGKTD